MWVAPALLVMVLVIGYPLIQVIVYSFLKYKLDGVNPPSFIGLSNYAFIFTDPAFWGAVVLAILGMLFRAILQDGKN